MKLEDFVGEHWLSGVDILMTTVDAWNDVRDEVKKVLFVLDSTTYMALEDPDDGFRSYMVDDIQETKELCMFRFPQIKVDVEYESDHKSCVRYELCVKHELLDGLIFKDIENGKVILELGTDHLDSDHPICVFRWTPENIHYNDSPSQDGLRAMHFTLSEAELEPNED